MRFTRNLGNIVMDLNDVEAIDLNTLGGTDTTTINDLTGTDLVEINVNQAGTIGGTAGDAAGRRRDRQRHQRERHHRRVRGGHLGRRARAGRPGERHQLRGGERLRSSSTPWAATTG